MASVADELREDVDRLIQDGDALLRGLATNTGQVTLDDFRNQIKSLIQEADRKTVAEGNPKPKGRIADRVDKVMKTWVLDFRDHYEAWYSEALALVSQVIPDRADDFRHLYKVERRKQIDYETYTLSDYQIRLSVTRGYLKEPVFDPDGTAFQKFTQQLNIVKAAQKVLTSRLADIRGVLQADLFDSELDAARELLKNGYLRAAGMVSGVVLERHLSEVARRHRVTIRSKARAISHYNDALKNAGILNVPRWRTIQGLADIRNLCGHAGERDPTRDEVTELIGGVGKITKNVN